MSETAWRNGTLGEVADLCLGKMLDQNKNRGVPTPYLANVNVRWGEFVLDDLRVMRFEEHERDRYGLKYGDIVMCEGGEPGRCAIWKEQMPGMMIQKALHRIRPKAALEHRFLYYSFRNIGLLRGFDQYFTGATIKHLPGEQLAKVEVLIPPLPTQRRIAGILSAYDDLIENSQRRIKILEEMARRLYREWFVHYRFPGHEGCRLVQSPLGEIPEGWEVGRLDEVLVLQRGFDLPKSDRVDGSVPIYAATGVTGFHDTAKVGSPGVVTGRSGSIGEVLYVQEDFWPLNTALWVKDFPRSEPLYAYYLLSSLDLKQFNSGAAVPTLNRNDIHGIQVLIPSQDIQQHFQYVAGSLLSQVRAHSLQINNLHRTRDLLLPRLLSGQIDVEALPEPGLSEP
jgi:type I restriction enzyme S subunit